MVQMNVLRRNEASSVLQQPVTKKIISLVLYITAAVPIKLGFIRYYLQRVFSFFNITNVVVIEYAAQYGISIFNHEGSWIFFNFVKSFIPGCATGFHASELHMVCNHA